MLHLPLILILSNPAALPPATTPALSSLVAAEYAFADQTEKQGIRAGFMANLRPDSTVFIPRLVNGVTYYKTQLESGALLTWYPHVAEVAQSEDLGYCTGPWVYKTSKEADAMTVNGWFVTLWQREGNGPWKVRLDIGTPNPDPGERPVPAALPRPAAATLGPVAGQPGNANELLDLDRAFGAEAAKNVQTAYKARVDDKVRFYRKGRFPVEGAKAMGAALDPGTVSWQPVEGFVAAGGDLGWTRGTLQHQEKDGDTSCNYVRVWKKQGAAWKLVLDLELALPAKK